MTGLPRRAALDAYLGRVRAVVAGGLCAPDAVRALGAMLLRDSGVTVPAGFAPATDAARAGSARTALRPPPNLATPWLLGHVHEALLDPSTRRRAGAHYTPPAIARGLVALAREGHDIPAPRVCDPAVGGGAFLLAAAESLAVDGIDPIDVVRLHCFGGDIDAVAVDVARSTLALWARSWPVELDANVVVADAFAPSTPGAAPFDLVVGNPPFLNQLGRDTARSRVEAATLRHRFGDAATGYVDTAALFLLRGLELVGPGGRVALVQPHSTLVARDASGVRAAVVDRARITGVWFAKERVFDASVRVWAPVFEREGVPRPARQVARRVGPDFVAAAPAPTPPDGRWTSLVADLAGIPSPQVRSEGAVGDLATATAGFRDQFYGLVGSVHEHERSGNCAHPRLVTSGLIEPLDTAWGRVDARFAGERWGRPVVDLERLAPDIGRWVMSQLVPKLVIATQTKVLEVAVDEHGDIVPSTPVIAVHASPEHLWHLAAALSAPPVSALAQQAGFGAALSMDSMKLSARQVLALPLPGDRDAWDDAALRAQKVPGTTGAARREALEAFGTAACAAYGVATEGLLDWWLARTG